MNVDQLELFKSITLDYFARLAKDEPPPAIGESYLHFAGPELFAYTSLIRISGAYDGCIYMTCDERMIGQLLLLNGETDPGTHAKMDMCREFSNVLAGNAMRAFGDQWTISVPSSLGAADFSGLDLPPSIFVMPLSWREGQSRLVVGLRQPVSEI